MDENDKLIDAFLVKVNGEVLNKLSIQECGRIYRKQDVPAMTALLKELHKAFLAVYQAEILDDHYEWVMLPAVIRARKDGLLTLGIVTLDLQSSGEHWGTIFLTPAGMVDLQNIDHAPGFRDQMVKQLIPYDYYYTPYVPGDIHVNPSLAPQAVCEMLDASRADEAEPDVLEEAEQEDDLEL